LFRIAAAVIGMAFVWYVTGGGSRGDLIFRAVGSAAILALVPIVFVWKFFSTPSKMDAESKNTINELNRKLDDRQKREEIQRALGRFIERGQEIMVACGKTGLPLQENEATVWETEVQAFIREKMGPVYFSRFRNSKTMPQASRCTMTHPALPFIDDHSMTLGERLRVALCRGSHA
jgi:hypothetical protein